MQQRPIYSGFNCISHAPKTNWTLLFPLCKSVVCFISPVEAHIFQTPQPQFVIQALCYVFVLKAKITPMASLLHQVIFSNSPKLLQSQRRQKTIFTGWVTHKISFLVNKSATFMSLLTQDGKRVWLLPRLSQLSGTQDIQPFRILEPESLHPNNSRA